MAENDNTFIDNADNMFFEDIEGEQGKALVLEDDQKLNLVGIIQGRFSDAETARISHEHRWLKGYRNYRGLYDKHIKFRESEKSKVFVKITKTKVLAAFGQLVDVVFGTGKFPIGVRETKMPEGVSEYAHLDTQNPNPGIETSIPEQEEETPENPFDVGFEGDGKILKPGATFSNGKFLEEEAAEILSEGSSPMPEAIEIKPAQMASRRMEKLIHDQIEESNGSSEIRNGFICLLPYTDQNYEDFFQFIGRPELMNDERFATHNARVANTSELYDLIAEAAQSETTGTWIEFCDECSIPAAPVIDLSTFSEDPHLSHVELVQVLEHPTEGEYRDVRDPVLYSENSTGLRRHAPRLGEHSVELLKELGYSDDAISALITEGVVTATP